MGIGMVVETGQDRYATGESNVDFDWRLVPESRPLSISEQIAERISQAILLGEFQPGQRIPEQSIADMYQVSRGPVREALRLLEREGVVEILPRRGAQVTSLTVKEVTDIFNIRAGLIGLSMRLAVGNMRPDQLDQIKSWVSQLGKLSTDPDAAEKYVSISFRLSLYLSRASDNERLYELVRSFSRQTLRYSWLGLATPARRQRSAKIWRTMLRAIQTGDRDAAEKASRTLVEESCEAAISQLKAAPTSHEDAAV